jgi:MFS family permease
MLTKTSIRNVLDIAGADIALWYLPMLLGGCLLTVLSGYIMHIIPGSLILILGTIAGITSAILFALLPVHVNYWAWIFPAMICASLSIDLTFNVANVFFTSALPLEQQGLAGAMATLLVQLSTAVLLAFADIVSTSTAYAGPKTALRNVFWFECGCAGAALVIVALFVRIGVAGRRVDDESNDLHLQSRV